MREKMNGFILRQVRMYWQRYRYRICSWTHCIFRRIVHNSLPPPPPPCPVFINRLNTVVICFRDWSGKHDNTQSIMYTLVLSPKSASLHWNIVLRHSSVNQIQKGGDPVKCPPRRQVQSSVWEAATLMATFSPDRTFQLVSGDRTLLGCRLAVARPIMWRRCDNRGI